MLKVSSIETHLFSKSLFDPINKFVEAHSYHFTPLNSLNDISADTDNDSDLVADVDPDSLIRIVCSELKNGKAPGLDKVYNEILKMAISTGFCTHLAQAFTLSLKLKSVQSALSDLLTTSATHGTFSRPSTKRGLILIGVELNTNARESFEHC